MFIYGLYSTEDEDIIKYVGKTKCSLSKRLSEHLNGALKRKCKTHKDNWIRKTYKNGYEIKIKLIEECSDNIWEEREKYWIKEIPNVTNIAEGGEGGHGLLYNVTYVEMKKYISNLPFKIRSKEAESVIPEGSVAAIGFDMEPTYDEEEETDQNIIGFNTAGK